MTQKKVAVQAPAVQPVALSVTNVKKAIKEGNPEVLASLLTRANKLKATDEKTKALKVQILTLLVDAQKASTPAPAPKASKPATNAQKAPEKQEAPQDDRYIVAGLKPCSSPLIGKTVRFVAQKLDGTIVGAYMKGTLQCIIVVVEEANGSTLINTLYEDKDNNIWESTQYYGKKNHDGYVLVIK